MLVENISTETMFCRISMFWWFVEILVGFRWRWLISSKDRKL